MKFHLSSTRLPVRSLTVAALIIAAASLRAGEAAYPPSLDQMGPRPASPQTVDGYAKILAGETEAGRAALEEAAQKNSGEAAALYALSIDASTHNEFQRALELLCPAIVAGGRGPWAELFIEDAWNILQF